LHSFVTSFKLGRLLGGRLVSWLTFLLKAIPVRRGSKRCFLFELLCLHCVHLKNSVINYLLLLLFRYLLLVELREGIEVLSVVRASLVYVVVV
jgi:hypothetical protein